MEQPVRQAEVCQLRVRAGYFFSVPGAAVRRWVRPAPLVQPVRALRRAAGPAVRVRLPVGLAELRAGEGSQAGAAAQRVPPDAAQARLWAQQAVRHEVRAPAAEVPHAE